MSSDPILKVETARSGEPTASLNGIRIHSAYDPRREAQRLVDSEVPVSCRVVLCYGIGLGYHVEELMRCRPTAEIFVIEPDRLFFQSANKIRRLTDLFESDQAHLFVGMSAELVAMQLERYYSQDVRVLRLRSVYEQNRAYYEELDAAFYRLRSRAEINRNTLKRFGKLWVRNLSRNLDHSAEALPLRRLESLGRDLPVLLCAAGPTLDEMLPQLSELHKRCLVIAVDTSAAALMRVGIQPDITVVVDPQYWNTRHLDAVRDYSGILVSESSTHPRVFRLLSQATKVFCASLFPLGRYLEEGQEEMGELGAGGSVATAAWDLARRIDARYVIAAGLDLAFPGRATHCTGSFFEERARLLCSRLDSIEGHSFRYLHDAAPYEVPSTDGEPVLTDKRMEIYRAWFETQLSIAAEPPAYTLSSRGAAIQGITAISTDMVLQEPIRRNEITTRIDHIREHAHHTRSAAPERRAHMSRTIRTICSELEGLSRAALRAANVATNALTARNEEQLGRMLTTLDEIDAEIESFRYRELAAFLMQDVINEIESASGTDRDAPLKNSLRLYQALAESAEYHHHLLVQNEPETS